MTTSFDSSTVFVPDNLRTVTSGDFAKRFWHKYLAHGDTYTECLTFHKYERLNGYENSASASVSSEKYINFDGNVNFLDARIYM